MINRTQYKMMLLIIVTIVLPSCFFSSCYYDNVEQLYGITPCDTTAVTFSTTIIPILENNCYLCHSNAQASVSGGGVSVEGYDNVMIKIVAGNASESALYGTIAWLSPYSQMPKNQGQLSDCDIAKMRIWINAGALNN